MQCYGNRFRGENGAPLRLVCVDNICAQTNIFPLCSHQVCTEVFKGEKWRPNIRFSPVEEDALVGGTQDVSRIEVQVPQRVGNAQFGQLRQRLLDLTSKRQEFVSIESGRWSLPLFHELGHHL